MNRPRIRLTAGLCILCGVCEAVAPKTFHQLDDRTGIEITPPVTQAGFDLVLVAKEACPVDCIEVEEVP